MSRRVSLQQVLARIDGPAMPDVEQLAEIPLDELERQLEALGVDLGGEMDELIAAAGAESGPAPLETLQAPDLVAMSVDEVEQRLRLEGVDVAQYLAQAMSVIRSAAVATSDSPHRAGGRAAPHLTRRDGPGRRATPSRRGMPRALAASIVAVCLAGVVFTLVHEQGLPDGFAPLETVSREGGDSLREAAPASKQEEGPRMQASTARLSDEPTTQPAREAQADSVAPQARADADGPRERRAVAKRVGERDAAPVEVPLAAASGSRPEPVPPADGRAAQLALPEKAAAKLAAPPAAAPRQDLVLTLDLGAQQRLGDALRPVSLDSADREALVDLLSDHDTGPAGRLWLVMAAGRLVSARLQRGAGPPVLVERSQDGTLRLTR